MVNLTASSTISSEKMKYRFVEKRMDLKEEETRVVIVGGGICGLASALALHRKGIESIVLEKSKTLRASGAAIILQPNGWHALHQLGVAQKLAPTVFPILSGQAISVEDGMRKEIPSGNVKLRCLKRIDLLNTLAENLPSHTIRYRCQVDSIDFDPLTSYPILQLHDGCKLMSRVVIGCDGVHSAVAAKLGLSSTKQSSTCVTRGLTDYPEGHGFGNQFQVWSKHNVQLGLLPISHNSVYWFVTKELNSQDFMISRHPMLIKESTMEAIKGFPMKLAETVKKTQDESLHLTVLEYRAPWDLLLANFRKGTVTVAGDAMHAMGPFLAQGGSVSLEDAVILARCLSQKLCLDNLNSIATDTEIVQKALDEYVKQRKMRMFWLSSQTFLIGRTIETRSALLKWLIVLLLLVLFRDEAGHSRYRCGTL